MGKRLEGMSRNAGVHAAGVVIAPGPDHRLRAALQEQPRRNHDPVGDEGGRARRPPEDGLPRPQHADADPRRARRDQAHRGHRSRHRRHPARRCEDLSAVRRRPDLRHLPVRELGHARAAAQGQAAAPRRPDRDERALSPRPAQVGHGRRLHRAQGGQERGEVRAAAARADSRRHLRRHRLPGTGDAHRLGAWPASASARPTCCARPWGRKTPRSWPKQREALHGRAPQPTGSTRRRRRRSST